MQIIPSSIDKFDNKEANNSSISVLGWFDDPFRGASTLNLDSGELGEFLDIRRSMTDTHTSTGVEEWTLIWSNQCLKQIPNALSIVKYGHLYLPPWFKILKKLKHRKKTYCTLYINQNVLVSGIFTALGNSKKYCLLKSLWLQIVKL